MKMMLGDNDKKHPQNDKKHQHLALIENESHVHRTHGVDNFLHEQLSRGKFGARNASSS